jgi:hypothetical protein
MTMIRGLVGSLPVRTLAAVLALAGAGVSVSAPAAAQSLPEIRLSATNRVPACVTPDRLMRFLTERNPDLLPKFRNIAAYYKQHGERLRVRWDYAFFQMVIETNYLLFKNNAGQGDVDPRQNNFAGIGTTGGGVPGDSFPDVSTGVLGQMQHLVAYSGEMVAAPVATRTREKQEDIIALSRALRRSVTFRDLAGRWAVDRRYGRSIAFIADRYRERFCTGKEADEPPVIEAKAAPVSRRVAAATPPPPPRAPLAASPPAPGAAETSLPPPMGLVRGPMPARAPAACKVFTASYGGEKNVLIRRRVGGELHYTALQVLDGSERPLVESFIRTHAQGGEAIAEYPSREAALTSAFDLCPSAGGASG